SHYTPFFCTHTSPTTHYTLSLHDALPISQQPDMADAARQTHGQLYSAIAAREPDRAAGLMQSHLEEFAARAARYSSPTHSSRCEDRKSTRLNSSHVKISYAVFCLKKKKKK